MDPCHIFVFIFAFTTLVFGILAIYYAGEYYTWVDFYRSLYNHYADRTNQLEIELNALSDRHIKLVKKFNELLKADESAVQKEENEDGHGS